jgi:hypothetical protein
MPMKADCDEVDCCCFSKAVAVCLGPAALLGMELLTYQEICIRCNAP